MKHEMWSRSDFCPGISPHVVIATPARLNQHLKLNNVRLRESVEVLALDEADLLLSFGFEDDIKAITGELPNICQTLLMSATLGEDIDKASAVSIFHLNARASESASTYVHATPVCVFATVLLPPSHRNRPFTALAH
jgi:superfamily II DNA/RNA helicase